MRLLLRSRLSVKEAEDKVSHGIVGRAAAADKKRGSSVKRSFRPSCGTLCPDWSLSELMPHLLR